MNVSQKNVVLINNLHKIYCGNIIRIPRYELLNVFIDLTSGSDLLNTINVMNRSKENVIKKVYQISKYHLSNVTGVPIREFKYFKPLINFSYLEDTGILYKLLLLKSFAINKYKCEKVMYKRVTYMSDLIKIKDLLSNVDEVINQIRTQYMSLIGSNKCDDEKCDNDVYSLVSSRPMFD